ncbi:transposase [Lachnospiraceae bacterium WCA-9-b2]|uniref:Transposase n=1 Tax=Sporofaciens musculi TaxID=2681861 RepID=A0A7X3SKH3_9FIRM|nr:transposase [Sporofaciens musculi]MXP77623.1 transposase [Sporofaciens musculi]
MEFPQAGILYKKYDMGIPLARQERDWYRLGLCLSRSTMANWVIRNWREDAVQPVIFHYARSRARKEAEKLYRGFHGYLFQIEKN